MGMYYQAKMIIKKGIITFLHLFVGLGLLTSQVYAAYGPDLKEQAISCHLSPGSALDESKFKTLLMALAKSLTALEKTEDGEIFIGTKKDQLAVFEKLLQGFSDSHYIDNINFYGDENSIYFHSKGPRGTDNSGFLYQVSTVEKNPIPTMSPLWVRNVGGLKVRIYKRGAEFKSFLESQNVEAFPENLNLSLLFDEVMIISQIIQTENTDFAGLLMGLLKLKRKDFAFNDDQLKIFEDHLIALLLNEGISDKVLENILPDLLSLLKLRFKKDIKSLNSKLSRKISAYAVDFNQSSIVRFEAFSILLGVLSEEYKKSTSKNKLNTKTGALLAKLVLDRGIPTDLRESALKIILPDVIETFKKTKPGSQMNQKLLDILSLIGSDAAISESLRLKALEVTGDFTFSPLENENFDESQDSPVLGEFQFHLDDLSMNMTSLGLKEEKLLSDSYEDILLQSLSRMRLMGGIDAFPFQIKIVKNANKIFAFTKKGSDLVITLDSGTFKGFAAFKIPLVLLIAKKMFEAGGLELGESYLGFLSVFRKLISMPVFIEGMELTDENPLNPFFNELKEVALREDDGAYEAVFKHINKLGLPLTEKSYLNNIGLMSILSDFYLVEGYLYEGKVLVANELLESVMDLKNNPVYRYALTQIEDPIALEKLKRLIAYMNDIHIFTRAFEDLNKEFDDILEIPIAIRLPFFAKYTKIFPHIEVISYHHALCYVEMAKNIEKKEREKSDDFHASIDSAKSIAKTFLDKNKGSYLFYIVLERINDLTRGMKKAQMSKLFDAQNIPGSDFLASKIPEADKMPLNYEASEFTISDFDQIFKSLRSAIRQYSTAKAYVASSTIFQKLTKISLSGKLAVGTQYAVLAKLIEYTTDLGGFSQIHSWFIRTYDHYLMDKNITYAKKLSEKYLSWVKENFDSEFFNYMLILTKNRAKQLEIIFNLADAEFQQDEFDAAIMSTMVEFAKAWEIFCTNRDNPDFEDTNMVQYYFLTFDWVHYFHSHLIKSNNPLEKVFVDDVINHLKSRENYLDSELIPIHQNLIDIRLITNGISTFQDFERNKDDLKDKFLQIFDMTYQKIEEKMQTYSSKKDYNFKVSLTQLVAQVKKSVLENLQRLMREKSDFPGWSELMIELSQNIYDKSKKYNNLRFYQLTMEFLASQVGNRLGWLEPGHDVNEILELISKYNDIFRRYKTLANTVYEPTFEYIETTYPELENFLAGLHERVVLISSEPEVKLEHLKKARDIYNLSMGRDVNIHLASKSGKKIVKQLDRELSNTPEKEAGKNIERLSPLINALEKEVAIINKKKVISEIKGNGGIPIAIKKSLEGPLEKINMKTFNNGPVQVRKALKELTLLRNSDLRDVYEPVIKNGIAFILKKVSAMYLSPSRNPKSDSKLYLIFNEIAKFDSRLLYNALKEDADNSLNIFQFILSSFNLETGTMEPVLAENRKTGKNKKTKLPILKNLESLNYMIPFLARIAKKELQPRIVEAFNYLKGQSWLPENASEEIKKATLSLEKDLFGREIDAFYKRDQAIFLTRDQAEEITYKSDISDHTEIIPILEEAEVQQFIKEFGDAEMLSNGNAPIPVDRIRFIVEKSREIFKSGKEIKGDIYVDANIRKIGNIFNNAARFHKEVQKQRDQGFHSYIPWDLLLDAVYQIHTGTESVDLDLDMFEGAWKGKGGVTKWELAAKKMLAVEIKAMKNNVGFGDTYAEKEWGEVITKGKTENLNWKEFLVKKVYGYRYSKNIYSILKGENFEKFITDAVNSLRQFREPGTTMSLQEFENMALDSEAELLMAMFNLSSPVEREQMYVNIRLSLEYLRDSYDNYKREEEGFAVYVARNIYVQEYKNIILPEDFGNEDSLANALMSLKEFEDFNQKNLDQIVTNKEIAYIQKKYPEVPVEEIGKQVSLLKEDSITREAMNKALELENRKAFLTLSTTKVFEKNPLLKKMSELSSSIGAEVEDLFKDFMEKDLKDNQLPGLEDMISRVEVWYASESAVYLFEDEKVDLPTTLITEELLVKENENMEVSQFKEHLNSIKIILPGSIELFFDRENTFELGFEIKPNLDLEKLRTFLDSFEGIEKITRILTYAEEDRILPDSPLIITPDINEKEEYLRELIKTFNALYRGTLELKYDKGQSAINLSVDPGASVEGLKKIFENGSRRLGGLEEIVKNAKLINLKKYLYSPTIGELKVFESSIKGSLSMALSEISLMEKAEKRAVQGVDEKKNRIEEGFDLFSKALLKVMRELFSDKNIEDVLNQQVVIDEDENNISDIFERYLKDEYFGHLKDISKRSIDMLVISAQKGLSISRESSDEQVKVLSKLSSYLREGSIYTFLDVISTSLGKIIVSNSEKEISDSEFNSNVTCRFLNEVITILETPEPVEEIQIIVFPPKSGKISA